MIRSKRKWPFVKSNILLLLILFSYNLASQDYNNFNFEYSNIEINPSFTVSDTYGIAAQLSHFSNLKNRSNKFTSTNFIISKKLNILFSGIGLSISATNIEDKISSKKIGLSYAYRNILFNKLYIKFGINYRFIETVAPKGYYSNYSFASGQINLENSLQSKINYSISICSPKENYYIAFGQLNLNSPFSKAINIHKFSNYMYLQIGNFWRLIRRGATWQELLVTIVHKKKNDSSINYLYKTTIHNALRTNRHSWLRYGGDFVLSPNQYFAICPSFAFYHKAWRPRPKEMQRRRVYRKALIAIKLKSEIAFALNNYSSTKPVYYLSLTYNY